MKRILCLAVAVFSGVALVSCGNDDDNPTDTTVAETTVVTDTTTEETDTTVEETEDTVEETEDTLGGESDTTLESDVTITDTTGSLSDPDEPSDTSDSTDDTVGGSGSSSDASTVAALIAQGIKEEAGDSISDEDADCMSRSMLDRIGAAKIIELGGDDVNFDDLPEETQLEIFKGFEDCQGVLEGIMAGEIGGDGTLTDEQALCVSEKLVGELGAEGLFKLAKSGEVDTELQLKLVELMGQCLPPDVIATLGN